VTEFNESIERPGTSGQAEDSEQGVRLRIIEILGLYRPGFSDRRQRADRRPIRCGYQPGYISSDDRGRVFINHRPRRDASENWQRARAKDTQYIEAEVEVVDPSGVVPGSAKIRWTIRTGRDNALQSMRSAAADEVDDLHGECDFLDNGHRRSRPVFEAVDGYPATPQQAQMETDIVSGRSRVRMHVTNVSGEVWRLSATLVNGPSPEPEVSTGKMTMWKRIDVEYHRMNGVPEIDVGAVARAFEIARIQLDFTDSIALSYRRALVRRGNFQRHAGALLRRVFRHAHRPGWFCVIAADLEYLAPSLDPARKLYPLGEADTGPGQLLRWTFANLRDNPNVILSVPATIGGEAKGVTIYEGAHRLSFGVSDTIPGFRAGGEPDTALVLEPRSYYPEPEAGDGSWGDAARSRRLYLPFALPSRDIESLGFEHSAEVGPGRTLRCKVEGGTIGGAYGVTPLVNGHFAGRSVVFMGRCENSDRATQTCIHELCHAFGFPHSCGHRQVQAGEVACSMCILSYWRYREGSTELVRWRHYPRGNSFCDWHLCGLRAVHLEDNSRIWRWP
jgi:hypothetical protein